MIRNATLGVLLAAVLAAPAAARKDEAKAGQAARFMLPSVGGWVMTPDNVRLIISVPTKGQLVYFDTVADKELEKVEVDFQPTCLALQGKSLFAGSKGSGLVYQLDADTGKEQKSFKVPGGTIQALACHPEKGLVYASNDDQVVFTIDPKTGKVTKTAARGMYLAVDPVKGAALYTGSIMPTKEVMIVRGGNNGELRVTFGQKGGRAVLLKYAVVGNGLKLVDGTDNAAIGAGGIMHLSPDGKDISFIAGGGWWSKTDPRQRLGVAVFGTDDLKTMRGSIGVAGGPQNIAFHPALKLGVGLGNNVDLHFFNPKSLVVRKNQSLQRARHTFWFNLLTFGGKGTKVIHLQGENLSFVPLDLTDADRKTLKEFYDKPKK